MHNNNVYAAAAGRVYEIPTGINDGNPVYYFVDLREEMQWTPEFIAANDNAIWCAMLNSGTGAAKLSFGADSASSSISQLSSLMPGGGDNVCPPTIEYINDYINKSPIKTFVILK